MAEFDFDSGPATQDAPPADPSPATENTPSQTDTSPSSGTDAPAEPSTATPLSEREGLLQAVRAVVNIQETPAIPDEGQAATQGQDTDTAGTAGQTPGPTETNTELPDPTEADLRKLRPETKRRFEQLLSQRDDARRSLEALRPDLEQHAQLQGYLRQHQLAPDDVNLLLGVGAALRRGDYQAFLNGVMPYVQAAEEAVGRRFSPDLQQQVDDGLITEETARDLTQTRFRAAQAESRLQEVHTTRTQEDQGRALTEVRTAVENWENSVRGRDPDYALKADTIRRVSQALLQERGSPRNPQEALALVNDAYIEATNTLTRIRPPPRPTRMAPSGLNGSSHGAAPEPTSMKEAVLLAVANMRRAS